MNYYIQGNKEKADQIKAAFEKLGIDVTGFDMCNDNILFFTYELEGDGKVISTTNANLYTANIIKTHPDYKELELPVEQLFKVGDWLYHNTCGVRPILVKDYSERRGYKVECIGIAYYLQKGVIEKEYHLWSMADAKDGDVLATDNGWTCIFQAFDERVFSSYCFMDSEKWFCKIGSEAHTPDSRLNGNIHPATKEQRDLLFKRMKEAGYTWDEKKKELCKIIEPQFKVGDDIKTGNTIETIAGVDHDTRSYYCESGRTIYFANQDLWHLVPKPHYDIANFKPKQWVLVRDDDEWEWALTRFSYLSNGSASLFVCINGASFQQCIPFEGNEHLLGTTDMCDEMYINW